MGRYEDTMSLCLRRGFLIPAAEIYGGLAGFYDYGHNGARLRRRWEDLWMDYFLSLGPNYHLIDTTTVLPYAALKASGHVDLFTDVMVQCTRCGEAYKAEALLEEATGKLREGLTPEQVDQVVATEGVRCPRDKGPLGKAYPFNLMFALGAGPKGEDKAYLRPETAQGVYLNFRREFELLRKQLPMGLAIVGRAYRNEIAPRQAAYRMREFLQAELQIFFNPKTFDGEVDFDAVAHERLHVLLEAERGKHVHQTMEAKDLVAGQGHPKWYVYHLTQVQRFYLSVLGFPDKRFRFYEVGAKERAHYNRIQFDIQIDIESFGGFREVGGVHYRTDYDLRGHQAQSKEKMEIFFAGERFIPHVLELSFGVDRNVWALLDAFLETGERTILHLAPRLAPVTVAVFPLVNKDGLPERGHAILKGLQGRFTTAYDCGGSIGRRYARQDEVGTPFCVTVDYETLEGKGVTLRERDTMAQARVSEGELYPTVRGLLDGTAVFKDLPPARGPPPGE